MSNRPGRLRYPTSTGERPSPIAREVYAVVQLYVRWELFLGVHSRGLSTTLRRALWVTVSCEQMTLFLGDLNGTS